MNIFTTLLVNPIINIIVAFYHGLLLLHIPYALGFAIILMTAFIRLLLAPLIASQLHHTKKMQELTPHLSKIKEKHKGDMQKQQQATMALYQEHGVNPAAGCLPLVVQMGVLIFGLYPALRDVMSLHTDKIMSTINGLVYFPPLRLTHAWDTNFFGFSLEKSPQQLFSTMGAVVIIVPLLAFLFQFIQVKMAPLPALPEKKDSDKKEGLEDVMASFQKQSLMLAPVMVGFFSFTFPIGLVLYWNTFTLFGIIQQYKLQGWGNLEPWIQKITRKQK